MIKLAFVCTHPIQYFVPLFRALANEPKLHLRVFYCSDYGVNESYDRAFCQTFRWDIGLTEGYEHVFLPNVAPRPNVQRFFGIINPTAIREIAAFHPDAVVVNGYALFSQLTAIGGSLVNRIPILTRGDSNILRPRPAWIRAVKAPMLNCLFRAFAGALAVGTLNAKYYMHYGIPPERVFSAPYTVDNDFFQSRRDQATVEAAQWRQELGIGKDTSVVLYAGKLYDIKAPKDLLRAFISIARRDAALVMVGDGRQRRELQDMVRDSGASNVRLVGFLNQSQMPKAYAIAQVLVVPSRQEAWGLVVNEAMNFALPIVASDQVGAVPDLVGDDNGWVFPAGNVPALAKLLDGILQDRSLLEQKGKESARRIAKWGIPETARGILHAVRTVA